MKPLKCSTVGLLIARLKFAAVDSAAQALYPSSPSASGTLEGTVTGASLAHDYAQVLYPQVFSAFKAITELAGIGGYTNRYGLHV